MRIVKKIVRRVDIVIEVLDSRDPDGTRCKGIEKFILEQGKVLLIAVNKCDLIDKATSERYKHSLRGLAPAVFTSAREKKGTKLLRTKIHVHGPNKAKIKVALVGYPNVGKSLLANALKGKSAAAVAPTAGHTTNVQWVKVPGGILLHDLPGVFPRRETEKTLALKCAISPDKAKDPEEAAVGILKYLLKENPEAIVERYGVELVEDPYELLEAIGKKRGKLSKGGEVDINATARIVMQEWASSRLEKYKKSEKEPKYAAGGPTK